jgi:hypothetical protein
MTWLPAPVPVSLECPGSGGLREENGCAEAACGTALQSQNEPRWFDSGDSDATARREMPGMFGHLQRSLHAVQKARLSEDTHPTGMPIL